MKIDLHCDTIYKIYHEKEIYINNIPDIKKLIKGNYRSIFRPVY